MSTPDPKSVKVFPRNLTARAGTIIRGNPANSRPESGVQNCFPGLEFDLRNIEQIFLRGLAFEYHREDGAILVRAGGPVSCLTPDEIKSRPLYLWAMYGRNRYEDDEPSLWGFRGQSGLDVWARVHDLLPGAVAILMGPVPGFSNTIGSGEARSLLEGAYSQIPVDYSEEVHVTVKRDASTKIEYVVVAQHRSQYVDADGVISQQLFPPGELTKSLCAPWIYDFRDCWCFYWASNKPDVVDSEDGKQSFVNFLRRVPDRVPNPPQDLATFPRRELELTYEEMIGGWWQKLPVVLNDRESTSFAVPPTPTLTEYLTRDEVVAELTYLATVEHALIVEYLYAIYSTKAPRLIPKGAVDEITRATIAATSEVYRIALDEMRHFRWVNEVLGILEAPPSVDRATVIGQQPKPGSGRKLDQKRKYLERPFELRPLDRKTQQWFIDVEAPSQEANHDLDGMYVAILESINYQPDLFPKRSEVLPIIKLIIDEGQGHYQRFLSVQRSLQPYTEAKYLRVLSATPPTQQQKKLSDLCDAYYHSIEEVVQITFSLGDKSGGLLLKAAVRSMDSLHEAAYMLAVKGKLPQFNRPAVTPPPKKLSHSESLVLLQSRWNTIETSLTSLEDSGQPDEKSLALHQLATNAALYHQLQEIVRNDAAAP